LTVSENLGISCTVAENGEDAAAMIEQNNDYNIFFIDWMLPGMNGVELTRQINKKANPKSIVTIFSSADRDFIEGEARGAGVEKFIPKPLFPSVIVDLINEYIGLEKQLEHSPGAGYTGDFTGYTILLAEDVEINREIVTSLLEPMNLKIECAENGAVALGMFAAAPELYDMIFMDIQMPEMDGYEATQKIRALGVPRAKTVPIIAMTANAFREDVEKCLESGMNGHVGKPIDFDEVIAQLRRQLKREE